MKTIYLTRHGQTEWNILQKMQGRQDSPLTEMGENQGKKLGKRLSDVNFDIVYSSPSGRAVKTAQNIINSQNCKDLSSCNMPSIITDERLMEISLGRWEGKLISEVKNTEPENLHHFFFETDKFNIDGVETYEMIKDRVKSFLHDLFKTDYKTILIVSHGVTVRTFWSLFDNALISGVIPNPTGLTIFEINSNLTGRLITHNDIMHFEV